MLNQQTILYVIDAPYFWLSMGMTTAVAMFVGALLYDGDLSMLKKGIISVLLYAFFVFQVDLTRIMDLLANNPGKYDFTKYGGVITILFVTMFWLAGIFFGVYTSHLVRVYCKNHKK